MCPNSTKSGLHNFGRKKDEFWIDGGGESLFSSASEREALVCRMSSSPCLGSRWVGRKRSFRLLHRAQIQSQGLPQVQDSGSSSSLPPQHSMKSAPTPTPERHVLQWHLPCVPPRAGRATLASLPPGRAGSHEGGSWPSASSTATAREGPSLEGPTRGIRPCRPCAPSPHWWQKRPGKSLSKHRDSGEGWRPAQCGCDGMKRRKTVF